MPPASRIEHKSGHTEAFLKEVISDLEKEGAAYLIKKVAAKLGGALAGGYASIGINAYQILSTFVSSSAGRVSSGSDNVFIEGKMAARAGFDTIMCGKDAVQKIAQGDSVVFINGMNAARVGDMAECGGVILEGSSSVNFNGAQVNVGSVPTEAGSVVAALAYARKIAKGVKAANDIVTKKGVEEKAAAASSYVKAIQGLSK